ncbi:hypothetical protein CBER1_10578 [Cercospora berteroae]|uniref:Xylanolytic transcriptional activator regulatory domain-containing protein n=1 Tax=Cercospora berteroae TaxID=357750 RepID=A0A2S6BY69_9PEZI|nr:hypothetical protein CBER1_10578 [Cercospora berteroae]
MALIRDWAGTLCDGSATGQFPVPCVPGLVKVVVAIGLVLDAGEVNKEIEQIMVSVKAQSSEALLRYRSHIDDIRILALLALYFVYIGDEPLASRTNVLTARTCLELGWHRLSALQRVFPDESSLNVATDVFWSVYILDRRASLGFGISSVIQDSDIDTKLPFPSHAYLSSMLEFARLTGKIFSSTNSRLRGDREACTSDLEYMDFQIDRWYRNLSPDMTTGAMTDAGDEVTPFVSAVLYARKNQAKIVAYRPYLLSAEIAHKTSHCNHIVRLYTSANHLQSFLDLGRSHTHSGIDSWIWRGHQRG